MISCKGLFVEGFRVKRCVAWSPGGPTMASEIPLAHRKYQAVPNGLSTTVIVVTHQDLGVFCHLSCGAIIRSQTLLK